MTSLSLFNCSRHLCQELQIGATELRILDEMIYQWPSSTLEGHKLPSWTSHYTFGDIHSLFCRIVEKSIPVASGHASCYILQPPILYLCKTVNKHVLITFKLLFMYRIDHNRWIFRHKAKMRGGKGAKGGPLTTESRMSFRLINIYLYCIWRGALMRAEALNRTNMVYLFWWPNSDLSKAGTPQR